MSEKEQQFERIYKETENFGRTQFVREIQMQINDIKNKDKEIEGLKEELEYTIPIVEHNKTITKHLKEIERLNNIINELEKWLEERIEKHTEDYLDWKYDRNVYLAVDEKLQDVFDKLQELKGSDKE